MQFRLTLLLTGIILTVASAGCAAEEVRIAEAPSDQTERVETKASPFVGTWRWAGSGGKIGDIELGEEEFVFREDGTYAVVSKAGDGFKECYEGTFTWSTDSPAGHGLIVFKGSHIRDTEQGFERSVYLDGEDLHFEGGGGVYRRTGPALVVRCP